MPQLRDVVVDPVLSNVSTGYANESFIAEKILPVMTVSKQTGIYYQYDKSNLRVPKNAKRAPGAPAREVDFSVSTASFFCEDHALKEFVPNEIQEQAMTPQDPLTDATENITEMLMLDKEKALATWMANTANITQNKTLAGTSQWSDYDNSDPIGDVRAAKSAVKLAVGKVPNTLILSYPVYEYIIDHPDIVDRIKYSAMGVVTLELLARVFGVQQVLLAEAVENSAAQGQVDSLAYVWGKHAWLAFIAPATRMKQLTFGYTMQYGTKQTERWTDGDRKGTYVRTHDNYDQVIVAATAAYLLKDVVA